MFEASLEISDSYYGKNHIETIMQTGSLGNIYR